ncbi:hypothetical protein B0A50_01046 [Salinomyces thailandicus]|uniref:Uncharacterized protein n=1 Tax=Salinomyces thailandicus TaxID=706561 RepID=A0A4U0UBI6_9PEZI|nr:hypothetical protein B0A50_01046 [Salinomyces thailandica]
MPTSSHHEKLPTYQEARAMSHPQPVQPEHWLPDYEMNLNKNLHAFGDPEAQHSTAVVDEKQRATHSRRQLSRLQILWISAIALFALGGIVTAIVVGSLRRELQYQAADVATPNTTVPETPTQTRASLLAPRSSSPLAQDEVVIVTVTVTAYHDGHHDIQQLRANNLQLPPNQSHQQQHHHLKHLNLKTQHLLPFHNRHDEIKRQLPAINLHAHHRSNRHNNLSSSNNNDSYDPNSRSIHVTSSGGTIVNRRGHRRRNDQLGATTTTTDDVKLGEGAAKGQRIAYQRASVRGGLKGEGEI